MTWRMQPRRIDRPRPGMWAIRQRRGAVEVAARIFWHQTAHEPGEPDNLMERSPILSAEINGEPATIDEVWLRRGREIGEAEFRFLLADRAWARAHAPSDPAAAPERPVDLFTVKPPF